ncbi:MAG: hypothetical protein J5I93_00280 [Pirellulaceae bacterium]|nr:hypothetical protein [Pirellulaceae bacterium]
MSRSFGGMIAVLATWLLGGQVALGQLQFEAPPIDYGTAPVHDPVARLQQQLDAGQKQLKYDERLGYLPSVLEALGVPASSQMLVFTQTSFQLRKISPHRPRAVYFSDDAYVGWVQFGDVLEISAVDPEQGAVFYTLEQQPTDRPLFVRDRGQCLTCHASSRTQGVPGHLVRSVYPDAGGRPILGSGTFTTSHSSPFKERWGGWYVTGTHGDLRHMGNAIVRNPREADQLDLESGANRTDLQGLVDTSPYARPGSDIVALMVLEHQTQMHNYITLANFETRHAMHYNQIMNKALERPDDHLSDSTQRRIDAVAEKLVRYLLFADEFPLTSPVRGTSGFAEEFSARGPHDRQGRSLRQLQLDGRMMKYPCSYLIYSEAFDALPEPVKQNVYRRLDTILRGEDTSGEFVHLTPADRQAIREILADTLPEAVAGK